MLERKDLLALLQIEGVIYDNLTYVTHAAEYYHFRHSARAC